MRDRDSSFSAAAAAATAAAPATTTVPTGSSAASQFAARIEALRAKDQRWQLVVGGFGCVFVLLIVVMGAISTFHSTSTSSTLGAAGLSSSRGALRGALSSSSFARDTAMISSSQSAGSRDLSFANHLVMVAGHAVLDNDRCGADLLTDAAWVLLDYQRDQGVGRRTGCDFSWV